MNLFDQLKQATPQMTLEVFNELYPCNCTTCKERKEKGFIPFNTGARNCAQPISNNYEYLR